MKIEDITSDLMRIMKQRGNEYADDKLRKLLVGAKIRFPTGNTLLYCQDMRCFLGVPDMEFEVCDISDANVVLMAPGHGGTPYGNGKLHVFAMKEDEPTPEVRGRVE